MHREVGVALGALLWLSCGEDHSRTLPGLTEDCTLGPVVQALVDHGVVDCSPERDESAPIQSVFDLQEPLDQRPIVQCMRAAHRSGRAAIYLAPLLYGIDSMLQWAKLVDDDGYALSISYDSAPGGDGQGAILYSEKCASFDKAPNLGCDDVHGLLYACVQPRTRN